jgi:hypothetical protein
LPAATARNHTEPSCRKPELLEELAKPTATSGGIIGVFVVTAYLDVDTDTHQRLPPISPFRQRCPRL